MGLDRLKILAIAARKLEELAAQATKRPISRAVDVLRSKIATESEQAVAELMETSKWTPPRTESRVLDALMKKPGGSNDFAKTRLENRLRRELFNTGRGANQKISEGFDLVFPASKIESLKEELSTEDRLKVLFSALKDSSRKSKFTNRKFSTAEMYETHARDTVRKRLGFDTSEKLEEVSGGPGLSNLDVAISKSISKNEPGEGVSALMQKEPWVDAITGEVRSDLPPPNVLKAMLAEDNAKRFAGEIPNPKIEGGESSLVDPLRRFYREQAQISKAKGQTMKAGFFQGLDRQEEFYEKSVGVGRQLREAKASGVGGANRNRMALLRDRTVSGDLSRLDDAVRDSLTFEADAGPGWVRDSVMETLLRMGGGDKQSKLAGVSLARLHQDAPLVAQFLIREAKAVSGSTTYAKQGKASELNAAVEWVKQAMRQDPENIPVGDLVRVLRSAAYRRGSGEGAIEGLRKLQAIRTGDKRPIISQF